jgi:DNA-binding NarL/FixJ family response regulator
MMTTTTLPRRMTPAGRTFRSTPRGDPLNQLSAREWEVLALMAEGRSNRAIGEQLTVALKTVETHVSRVFTKLGLNEDRYGNSRVLAVLAFLSRESRDPTDAQRGAAVAGSEALRTRAPLLAHPRGSVA